MFMSIYIYKRFSRKKFLGKKEIDIYMLVENLLAWSRHAIIFLLSQDIYRE